MGNSDLPLRNVLVHTIGEGGGLVDQLGGGGGGVGTLVGETSPVPPP